jgi:outer membrane protein assembly factor BamB
LYVSGLAINGGTHNVVFVASMLNTVYALDADNGTVLWSQNFGTPITPQKVENDQNISWSTGIGILSTPVIDPATNIMYFVTGFQNGSSYSYRLNAIEIATGLAVHGSPITITAAYSTADLSSPLVFNPERQNQRAGLAVANGDVYVAFGSHEDQQTYRGWVMAYNKSTLAQTAVYAGTKEASGLPVARRQDGAAAQSARGLLLQCPGIKRPWRDGRILRPA